MQKNSKKKTVQPSTANVMLFLYNFLIITACVFLLSIVALIADLNNNAYHIYSIAGISAGSMICGFINGRIKKQNGLLNGVIFTLPSNLLLIIFSLYLNEFSADYLLIFSIGFSLMFAALGGVLSVNIKKKTKIKR